MTVFSFLGRTNPWVSYSTRSTNESEFVARALKPCVLQVEVKDQVFLFFFFFCFFYALLLVLVSGYRRIIFSEFSFTTEWEIFPFSVAYRLQWDIVSYTVFLLSKNIFWWNSRREREKYNSSWSMFPLSFSLLSNPSSAELIGCASLPAMSQIAK